MSTWLSFFINLHHYTGITKLFDKRIENYSIVSGLVKLYGDNRENFNDKDVDFFSDIDLKFFYLTNNP